MKGFEPKIVPFVCDWCSLQAADFAGVTKLYFPRRIGFIRVSCSGRVNPEIAMDAFINGADGVLIMGCAKGNCNYLTGNYQVERTARAVHKVMGLAGFNPERLRLHLESDTEISSVYLDFYKDVKEMGEMGSELSASGGLKQLLLTMRDTLLDEDLKWLVGREWTLTTRENVYGSPLEQEEFDKTMEQRIKDVFLENLVRRTMEKEPLTTLDVSKRIEKSSQDVFRAIMELKRKGKVKEVGVKERYPAYLMV